MARSKKILKLCLIACIGCAVISGYYFGWFDLLNLTSIQEQKEYFHTTYQHHPILFIVAYFLIYVLVAALSIPGASVLTLLAGALFGTIVGSIVVILSATVGATLAFLSARFLFRDALEKKYQSTMISFNKKFEANGAQFLLFLRLVPAFPFFIVNLVMGLTRVPILTYFFISLIGMYPATVIYCNAGKQLSSLESLSGLVSPQFLIALSLLGGLSLVPMLVSKLSKKSKNIV